MRLHTVLLAARGASVIVGCGASEPTAPPPPVDHVGGYQLTEIVGKPLPATVVHQLNS
jgi:hypothetical protein